MSGLTVLGAFILPPYLGAIGWILLAGPNAGFINQLWRWHHRTTDAAGQCLHASTAWRCVMALQSFPLIFIFVKSALDLVSSEMEDAANILGAGTWTTMRKVTLPLVWPSILGGIIIVFLETVALFGTPAIIGIPARINVVTTQLWQFFEYPVRVEVAAAYAMPLLLITAGDGRRAAADAAPAGATSRRPARAASGGRSQLGPWRLALAGLVPGGRPALGRACRCWCCCRPRSRAPGAAASASTTSRCATTAS